MSLRPSVAEETGTGLPKDTWSFHLSWPTLFGPSGHCSAVAFVGFDHRLAATTIDIALRPLPSVHSDCRCSFRLPTFILIAAVHSGLSPVIVATPWPLRSLVRSSMLFVFFFFAIITGSVPLFHHRLRLSPFPGPLFLAHSYCRISFLDII